MAKKVTFRPSGEVSDMIEAYKDAHGGSKTEAIHDLIEAGYRETKNPITYRIKGEAIDWAGYLGIFAIISILAGVTMPIVAPAEAVVFALSLVVAAAALVGLVEAVRLAEGTSELGEELKTHGGLAQLLATIKR